MHSGSLSLTVSTVIVSVSPVSTMYGGPGTFTHWLATQTGISGPVVTLGEGDPRTFASAYLPGHMPRGSTCDPFTHTHVPAASVPVDPPPGRSGDTLPASAPVWPMKTGQEPTGGTFGSLHALGWTVNPGLVESGSWKKTFTRSSTRVRNELAGATTVLSRPRPTQAGPRAGRAEGGPTQRVPGASSGASRPLPRLAGRLSIGPTSFPASIRDTWGEAEGCAPGFRMRVPQEKRGPAQASLSAPGSIGA